MRDSAAFRSARLFGLAWACGLLLTVLMVVMAVGEHLPVRDADDTMLRFPAILAAAIALDVVPRMIRRGEVRTVMQERWPARHWAFALSGLGAWYLCYATFRNVKSMVPFVNHHLYDDKLAAIDRGIWGGHTPAVVLHDVLGTHLAAHLFSAVYIGWIALVPVSIAIALVWTRSTAAGSWYVTAVAVDWVLGAVLYLLVPTLGPVYSAPGDFATLPHTYVTDLVNSLMDDRVAVLAHPWGSGTLQTIAAFPSLHVGIMTTIVLSVTLFGLQRWIRVAAWIFWVLTVFATLYIGWHFFCDIIGGAAVGSFAVWISAMTTGNHVGLRPQLRRTRDRLRAEPTGQGDASGAHPAPLG
ncbi:MAG TPA: phosphatase PAP2 family protein [Nocardioides sp.]|nr:phosphatase PAP2 family protein [Nocardioides sp.]